MSYKKITFILFLGFFLSYGGNVNAQLQTFSYTGALQQWTIPCATVITINCSGAQGGGVNSDSGGRGARMVGTFTVVPGQILTVLVGGKGTGTSNGNSAGGGGGGSFVLRGATPLIIAGGGGGRRDTGPVGNIANTNGSSGTSGQNSYDNGGIGGTAGNGGASGEPNGGGTGGPGGGLNTNGGLDGSAGGGWGLSYTNLAVGGAGCTSGSDVGGAGGYGGGGGGTFCYRGTAGGGGGYSGGGTGLNDAGAGGGGSFNAGTNQVNTTGGAAPGNGVVIITWVNANLGVTDTGKVLANEITCNGVTGKAAAKATGVGLSYKWAPGGQTTDTATGLSAGSYVVTVVSACGTSASASVTITQPVNVITATASTINNVLCNGGRNGSASVTASGVGTPYTYLWTPSLQTNAVANGLSAGLYTVNVINACGATASATTTITQPNPLAVVVKVTANIDCHGNSNGSAQSTVSGGALPYTFAWSPFGGNAANISGMPAGTYSVNVSDANGCTGSAVVNITQPASVLTTSVATTANVLCNGKSTGSASSSTKGGTTPYNYAWTGGGTKDTLVGLSVGTYTLTITDAHGCVVAEATTITQPSAVTVIAMQSPDNGNCSGAAWVMVNGGVIPYTYLWSPGSQTSAYNYGICGKDIYCCTITDAQGCKQDICDTVQNDLGVAGISSGAGKVTVYPNPNNGQFTIQSSVVSGQSSVEIYNVLGEKVFTTSLNAGGNTSININNQPNGVYLYRVLSNENGSLIGEGKLILNK